MNIKSVITLSSVAIPLALVISGCQMKEGVSNSSSDTNNNTLFVTTNSIGNNSTNSSSADNSQRNVRDRNGENQTPIDQGNSAADLQLTQQIRKMVVNSTNNFSVTAHNIKIITQNGQVTLRGPVQSDAEKANIEAIAKSVAGETNVTDQLEVNGNP